MKKNILVVFGGDSCEHDISIITGLQAINNLDKDKYNVIPFYIKDSVFLTTSKKVKIEMFSEFSWKDWNYAVLINNEFFTKHLSILKYKCTIDCVLLCTHGGKGENGSIQGYFESLNLPYTNSGVLPSAICMDKICSKRIFSEMNLDTIEFVDIDKKDYKTRADEILYHIQTFLDFPIIIKPANQGSSIGIKFAKDIEELQEGIEIAAAYDNKILCERALVDYTEINCAGLYNGRDLIISELEQPVNWNNFLTFENKYLEGGKMENECRIFPANVKPSISKKVKEMVKLLSEELNLYGVFRVDFLLDNITDKVYVNEINTIPGSLAFYLFKDELNFSGVLDYLIDGAVYRKNKINNARFYFDSPVLDNYKNASKNKNKISNMQKYYKY